ACCASAADPGGLANQRTEHVQVVFEVIQLVFAEREAGAEEGAFQALARADAQATTVELRTTATAGGEFFLTDRVQDNGVFQATAVFAGNADREVRNATNEVGGAVQR